MLQRSTREVYFNWSGMAFKECDLESVTDAFPGEDFLLVIHDFPSGKVPGPNGFIGAFLKSYWQTIKHDVMRVIHLFENLHYENFRWLNLENVVVLSKKDGVECISDF